MIRNSTSAAHVCSHTSSTRFTFASNISSPTTVAGALVRASSAVISTGTPTKRASSRRRASASGGMAPPKPSWSRTRTPRACSRTEREVTTRTSRETVRWGTSLCGSRTHRGNPSVPTAVADVKRSRVRASWKRTRFSIPPRHAVQHTSSPFVSVYFTPPSSTSVPTTCCTDARTSTRGTARGVGSSFAFSVGLLTRRPPGSSRQMVQTANVSIESSRYSRKGSCESRRPTLAAADARALPAAAVSHWNFAASSSSAITATPCAA
mmetsp:Transcript_25485/g.83895  ORF Transcript_25485/g.83895 Transcript_25485/m.83895 type:complete len:265 (+) Transcript_25485:1954-2748(+)